MSYTARLQASAYLPLPLFVQRAKKMTVCLAQTTLNLQKSVTKPELILLPRHRMDTREDSILVLDQTECPKIPFPRGIRFFSLFSFSVPLPRSGAIPRV